VRSTAPELLRPDRALAVPAIPAPDRPGLSVAHHDWIVWHADRIGVGETVFLDGSDGALALAKALAGAPSRGLTIVTNSLRITAEDLRLPATVLVCPGRLNQRTRTTEGSLTLAFLKRQRLDTAFVAGSGSIADAVRAIAERTVNLGVGPPLR
jgi:DeoR C terminal sensor domain